MLLYRTTVRTFFSRVLFFVLITACGISAARSYNEVRDRCKERLCFLQEGLMDHDDHMQFIELHIMQRAEAKLAIPKHLQKKQTLDESDEDYMTALAHLSVALFQRYANPKRFQAQYETYKRKMQRAILCVRNRDQINIDVDFELASTLEVLALANEALYKQLSWSKKAMLFFAL